MAALELVSRWPVDAAAAGVIQRTNPRAGASANDGAPGVIVLDEIGDIERPFAWASITKLLVAMATLVAVEEGEISLDDPAGPTGSTVRHLLSHASGLGPDSPVPVTAPERMRIYSNIGYEILADTLSERTGTSFNDFLTNAVMTPLLLTGTELEPGSSPASGAIGPLHDLLILAAELPSHPTRLAIVNRPLALAPGPTGGRNLLLELCAEGVGLLIVLLQASDQSLQLRRRRGAQHKNGNRHRRDRAQETRDVSHLGALAKNSSTA